MNPILRLANERDAGLHWDSRLDLEVRLDALTTKTIDFLAHDGMADTLDVARAAETVVELRRGAFRLFIRDLGGALAASRDEPTWPVIPAAITVRACPDETEQEHCGSQHAAYNTRSMRPAKFHWDPQIIKREWK